MANEPRSLHIGLADFAEPTLLLIGQPADLTWLAGEICGRRILALQSGATGPSVSLHMVPTDEEASLACQGQVFEWRITASEAQTVARQLQELAATGKPAHAYLDPTTNLTAVQVVVSCGEYEPSEIFGSI
jgi:hypothetical protein